MESINQSYFLVASPEFLVSPTKIAICWGSCSRLVFCQNGFLLSIFTSQEHNHCNKTAMSSEKSEIFSVSSANRLRHIYVEVNAEQR